MNVTRGQGLLENFLAQQRARIVDKNILDKERQGKILDIGCGYFPFFLSQIKFQEKFGLDKSVRDNAPGNIKLVKQDLSQEKHLPFADEIFEVVTVLAVLEHMSTESAIEVLREARRVLRPSGKLFITVPRDRGDKLLRFLSEIGLVSKVEISEHVQLYNPENLTKQLTIAGFKLENIKLQSFEFGLNLFAKVKK